MATSLDGLPSDMVVVQVVVYGAEISLLRVALMWTRGIDYNWIRLPPHTGSTILNYLKATKSRYVCTVTQ